MDRTGKRERDDTLTDAIVSEEPTWHSSDDDEMIDLENAEIRQKLRESGVIGRVLKDFMPCLLLKIIYQTERIYLGHQVLLAQVQTEPVISCCFESEPHGQHVILMTDADADAPGAEHLHWLVSRLITDHEHDELVAYEPPRTAGRIIVLTMFRIPESQFIYVPAVRENFSTRDFADMNNFGPPLSASFFYIKHEYEKNRKGVYKCSTRISHEGPSHSKIACAIPRTLRVKRKLSFEFCKPKEFKPMVFPNSVEKQKEDDVENGSTGRREENHSGTCSTEQISCKNEDDD